MVERGGFRFASTIASTAAEAANPWRLLRRAFADGAIPAIGDESAVRWQLHLDVGQDLIVQDERGREVRLRFVALLQGSMLQSEILVADAQFTRLFPTLSGHAFFLIEAPSALAGEVERELERQLAPFSFDVARSSDRLKDYFAVQNTYLSTFQTLGGIGLLLGTAGLAVVLLRNVWERRGELALMRTLGFSRAALSAMVLFENVILLAAGLSAGTLSALVAIAPSVAAHPASVPWASLTVTVLAVFITGVSAGAVVLRPALRAPLLTALRAE
jgi:hypothetical protein